MQQCFSEACFEEVSNRFTEYKSLSDFDDLIESEFKEYMVQPNIERLNFSFFVQVLPERMSPNPGGHNDGTELESVSQSVDAWWKIYDDIKTISSNQLEPFYNHL